MCVGKNVNEMVYIGPTHVRKTFHSLLCHFYGIFSVSKCNPGRWSLVKGILGILWHIMARKYAKFSIYLLIYWKTVGEANYFEQSCVKNSHSAWFSASVQLHMLTGKNHSQEQISRKYSAKAHGRTGVSTNSASMMPCDVPHSVYFPSESKGCGMNVDSWHFSNWLLRHSPLRANVKRCYEALRRRVADYTLGVDLLVTRHFECLVQDVIRGLNINTNVSKSYWWHQTLHCN